MTYDASGWAVLVRFGVRQRTDRYESLVTIFFSSKANFKIFPKVLPKPRRPFSVSEKLARYGSSALSSVEHLSLLVGKESVALVGRDMDWFNIFKIRETGSFAPVRKLADSLIVCQSGVLVPDRDGEKLEEPLGRFGADIGNDRWKLE
jgi:hypothetical protein